MNLLFIKELDNLKSNGLNISRIKPLVIINIDWLIHTASLLKKGEVSLSELLEAFYQNATFSKEKEYSSEEEKIQDFQNSLLSFANYIAHFLNDKFGNDWRTNELLSYLFHKKVTT
ncbi:MAG TPA: hypothetical protein VKC90_12060 [Chitinophagaceae bacterium]|nr:hypothetical protein [Chitinophagaceae bacterium]